MSKWIGCRAPVPGRERPRRQVVWSIAALWSTPPPAPDRGPAARLVCIFQPPRG
ncbi:hypothetical protein [Actinokineospora diospyrosa]|uniref:Uncharacterized protein n=1 Tax=Actinokineospora diospyrosa TaxID=103728 RepID=A0ABT1I4Y6_9PSEU|nr:hypothetical protein [Actinokineospora diospyrosa]MCP2267677.1 hypothetical protein [Actinokineospora diospyrosa]